MTIRITHKGETIETTEEKWTAEADAMLQRLGGPWGEESGSAIERVDDVTHDCLDDHRNDCERSHKLDAARAANDVALLEATATPANASQNVERVECDNVVTRAEARGVSEFGAGNQIVDGDAKARIEGMHEKLKAQGVNVDAGRQLYATGTRMATVGYQNQAQRAREHAEKMSLRECVAQLVEAVESEKRRDVVVSAKDFAAKLACDGALTFDGYKVREQAIRGLLSARLDSTAMRHVLGLRDRIADAARDAKYSDDATVRETAKRHMLDDKGELLHVIRHECERFGDVMLKLRLRDALGDAFACVSPEYAPADAPDALRDVVAMLPSDAKATFAYDPTSTAWELRASLFTPTPVEEQAVGEPFEGFASFRSRDNGTRTWTGGGGIILLACLNAGTYEAQGTTSRRRHIGRILNDVPAMVRAATASISTLCEAWGVARETVLDTTDAKGALIPIETAIPGFFRSMLTARKGELVGVLPGRTETHVKALTLAYGEQRRDTCNVVRADLAQAFTRYIQGQPAPVRRDAESAIGAWMVSSESVSIVAA